MDGILIYVYKNRHFTVELLHFSMPENLKIETDRFLLFDQKMVFVDFSTFFVEQVAILWCEECQ